MTAGGTRPLAGEIDMVDLRFQGVEAVIAAYVLNTSDGLALVDCGPSTTLDALLGGIAALGHDPARLRHILLTHIHLDHAGAAGWLARRYPAARVYVHEVGAPHALDPVKLLSSAARVWGDQMATLWGAVEPVPAAQVVVIREGDTLDIGGRRLDVLYTPGHASHHVAYHDPAGIVFAGDVAGVRIPPADDVWPPTPPPDVDVPAWHASIARLRELAPDALLLAHFGRVEHVEAHLDRLAARLDAWVALVQRLSAEGRERDAIAARLTADARGHLAAEGLGGETQARFALATPFGMTVDGILRYLRKRATT